MNIYVGGVGNDGGAGAGGAGGFNGGGMGGFAFANFSGGGGGGATDIRIGGVALSDRVLVAAGGGGAGLECGSDFDRGGDGGGLTGEDGGGACSAGNGFGGTPSTAGGGGSCGGCSGNPGMGGTAATGGDGGLFTSGGGGGGGLWGGGGAQWDGGAGGSSYTDPILATSVVHTRGFNTGAGVVTISYAIPTTYNIAWDPASTTAGFVDVTAASVTSSPINLVVPGAAPAATYTGTLTINNSTTTCSSVGYPISVTVKPIPDVAPIGSQIICDSTFTSAILFSGSVPGTSFDWTNSDASILLAATGSGDISSFIADDSSLSVPVTAVFTVTPSRLGCVGAVQTFSITVKPNPNVWPSSNQTICNNTLTAPINFSGHVAGTVYTWNNTNSSIGLPATGAGDIAAFLGIDTSTSPLSSTITVNTTANGCTGSSNSFTITIDPTPIFTSSLNPPAICNNTMFNYTPTSATPTTTFDWSRAVVSGISNPAATGSGDPAETLTNTTPNPITVVYVYTLTANTCTNVQSINVIVYPTPMLSSSLTPPAVCDSTLFTYIHTSATTGTAFAWSRGVVAGISNPASSGVDTIRETLVNTTPNPIMVTYVDTLTANGCKNIQTINLTVNPRPMLSSATTLSPICDGAHVLYIATSLTTGTSFTWSRGVIAGISNPADNGGDTISENLNNNSDNPVTVTYVDTLKANGCINTQNVTILVYPTPKLSSSLTPYAPLGLCDSSLFNYTPMSNTVGSGFTWTRDFIMGIGLPAGSGSGNPNEILYNNTNYNISVVYVYTISANGCTNTQNVAVVIHPVPTMASTLSMTTCSGVNFHYVPTGYVTGSTFVWNRSAATGIKPTSGAGAGTIDEVLTDTALVPLPTSYKFTLSANGCSHIQYLMVTVNPTPPMLSISTHSPGSLCSNTLYQNFGTDALPPAGQHYSWSATNATVWATGTGGQYSLISFKNPGHAVVSLNSNITGFSCIQNNTFDVTVGTGVSGNPQVVFHAGQLICLKADEDSYQWGFDDAHTLDSTIITGENNPNYFISGADFVNRYYWVITRNGDCMQKSYYNVPLGITNVNNETADIKVYPNPASDMVNVVINTSLDGKYEIAVMNLLGQVVRTETAADHKASMDVNSLPAGTYLVVCTRDGVKIGAQKFIKN